MNDYYAFKRLIRFIKYQVSIVEIAIIAVILAIIWGGVLVGQDMIEVAEERAAEAKKVKQLQLENLEKGCL